MRSSSDRRSSLRWRRQLHCPIGDYAADKLVRVWVGEFIPTTIVSLSRRSSSAEPLLDVCFAFETGWAALGNLAIRATQVGTDKAIALFGNSGNIYAFHVNKPIVTGNGATLNVRDLLRHTSPQLKMLAITLAMSNVLSSKRQNAPSKICLPATLHATVDGVFNQTS